MSYDTIHNTMSAENFKERVSALPDKPGCYLFRDANNRVIYVGKAARLRQRVRAYFAPQQTLPPKTQSMVAKIAGIDFIMTDSELEAILLECNLIKKHHPRYNVLLKDDKSYPYIKVSLNEDWPRLYFTRRWEQDGARYFGPFASARSVRETIRAVSKIFPFRTCTRPLTGTNNRPCLEYHMHRCLGPCIGATTREEYDRMIKQVLLFLEGKRKLVIRGLESQMKQASRNLQFEKAALLRDRLEAVHSIMQSQKVISPGGGEQDVIALAINSDQACGEIFFVRAGKLIGQEQFLLYGVRDEDPGDITATFITQFYSSSPHIPPRILLSHTPSNISLLQDWLAQRRNSNVTLVIPQRGKGKQLVDMAQENAWLGMEHWRIKRLSEPGIINAALKELQEKLKLPVLPCRVECYDVSNISGTSAVGSMIVFDNDRFRKEQYRRFRIKTVEGTDDYAMMEEVLRRRFLRREVNQATTPEASTETEGKSWTILPDLVVIDGGRGHLHVALKVFTELNITHIPVIALAKEKEEIFMPGRSQPIMLPSNSPALHLLQRTRDEAHRFAVGYHTAVRHKTFMSSQLDDIPGIGNKRKKALLKKFGSVQGIKNASVAELTQVAGMTRNAALSIKEHL